MCTSFGRLLKSLISCRSLQTDLIPADPARQMAREIPAKRPEGSSVSNSEQKGGIVNGFRPFSTNISRQGAEPARRPAWRYKGSPRLARKRPPARDAPRRQTLRQRRWRQARGSPDSNLPSSSPVLTLAKASASSSKATSATFNVACQPAILRSPLAR